MNDYSHVYSPKVLISIEIICNNGTFYDENSYIITSDFNMNLNKNHIFEYRNSYPSSSKKATARLRCGITIDPPTTSPTLKISNISSRVIFSSWHRLI